MNLSMQVCLISAAVLLIGIASITCTVSSPKKPLYIGGLLPLSESDGWSRFFGYSARVGAESAVADINNRSDVLPDYNLVLNITDSEADKAAALNRLYELLYSSPVKVAIFGPLLSGVTEILAQVIAKWNIIQMTPGASTPVLTDRLKYPHTYRTVTSATALAVAQIKIIHKFRWTKIATIYQAREPHIGRTNELLRRAASENISVIGTETFYDDPLEPLQRLKEKDVRIIIASFFEDMAKKLFCAALSVGMYGANYVWIVPGYFDDNWKALGEEEVDCSFEDLKRATEGYLAVTYSFYGIGTNVGRCGKTPEEFRREMAETLGYNISGETRGSAALSYDAMWSLAMAMHEAEGILSRSLDSYSYGDEEYARVVGQSILRQKFDGMSGRVVFHEGGYRIGNLLLEQNIGGNEKLVGTYNNIEDEVSWNIPTDRLWYYSGGKPPYDSDVTRKVDDLQSTPIAVMVVLSVLVAMGMILSMMFLVFNFWKRNNKQVKMSSPKVNNLIASGIMLAYLCVVLLGVDRSMVGDDDSLRAVCRARSWLMPVAFTLAFGGMFTKMWRVYSIVIANKTKRKVIKDRHLVGIIAILLLLDFAILVPWQIIDPIRIEENRTPVPQTKEDIANYTQHQLLFVNCTSSHITIWTMATLIYKAFVVVFGAFLAWSTRNVKVSGLNDSYYVGLSIYNTVICCVVAVPLSLLSVTSVGVTFALVSGFLLFCITASLCMLFFPKVIAVYRKNAIEDESFTGIRFGTTMATRPTKGKDIPTTSAQVESRSSAQ